MLARFAQILTVSTYLGVLPATAAAAEVTLYTTREPGLVQPLLEAFTKESGVKVNTVPELLGAVAALTPGQAAPLDVTRRDTRQQVQIVPAQRQPLRRAGR